MVENNSKQHNRVRRVVLGPSLVALLAGVFLGLHPQQTKATVIDKGQYTYKPQLNICGIPRNGDCNVIVVLP